MSIDQAGTEGYQGPILYYTDAVIEHFQHPRNVEPLPPDQVDGSALIGDPGCGDQMSLDICVREGRIAAISFKSFGCPGAISTSSMLTELALGKSVEDAEGISDDDVVVALGGIPENKKHCSLLGVQALQAAMADWRSRAVAKEPR
ncbi:MAG TPA: iron-sulfur cluster assembly scaffold protein [Spirochaetales bacterium]|nr:iron-sulfur cluster assembly scaffold protein [Spirochaetales bacterium]HRY54621.1 iron-sulfur cluster assembly scaffold protein [Spirochaetia bacterium]HRZ64436.1 iron-sulfur cluster assembly scaffold protein [Spirochaetia bacterium]